MAENKSRQKSRTHRISEGKRKSSRRVPLTDLQKVLLGGGMMSLPQHQENHRPRRSKKRVFGEADD